MIAFKNDMQFAYLFENFVWATYGSPWMQYSALGKMGPLPLAAARAFSQSVFGKHHHRCDIEREGQVTYGATVRELSLELGQVGQPGSESLIVPIMILLMHASTIPDPQAAFFHAKGLMKAMQICGPARFSKVPLRYAFKSCRATLFTIALIARQRTFLELPEWRTIPWSEIGCTKTPQNELVDILVFVPGLISDAAQFESGIYSGTATDIVKNVKAQLEILYQWRQDWSSRNPSGAYELSPSQVPNSQARLGQHRVFRKVLCFSSFTAATEICLYVPLPTVRLLLSPLTPSRYNAVLLLLLGILYQFQPPPQSPPISSPSTPLPTTPLLLPSSISTLHSPAIEILRIFESQMLSIPSSSNPSSALFWLLPLGLAHKVLEDEPDYCRWIKGMLETSKVTRGYGTGNNEYGFGSYKFPKMGREGVRKGMK